MEFEDILKDIGDFGFYQKFLVVAFLFPTFTIIPWISMNAIFVASTPDHWCHVPEVVSSGLSIEEQKYLIRPQVDRSCYRYDVNYSQILQSGNWSVDLNWPTKKCDLGWQYDTIDYDETATTKWNLVCDNEHYRNLIVSFVFMGVVIGTPIYGFFSDRCGRKPMFLFLVTLVFVAEMISAFSPYFSLFLVLRVFIGSTMSTIYALGYIIVLELVRPDLRARINAIATNCWTLGTCLLSMVAYLTRSWVYLSVVVSLAAGGILLFFRILPESPSWLISQERYEEATEILKRISKMNGKAPPEQLLLNVQTLGKKQKKVMTEKSSPLDFLRYPNLRKRFLLVIVGWIGVAIPYYGVQVNVTNLYGNEFFNFFLMALVEFPAHLITWWLLVKVGRKKTAELGFAVCTVSSLISFTVPRDYSSIGIIVSLISKAGSSSAFMSQYQLTPELFPTSLRGVGMGMSMTIGIGSTLVVPYIVQLEKYGPDIPLLIFSLISFFALMSTFFIPETRHQNLPQTVDDVEKCAKDESLCCCCGWNEKYDLESRESSYMRENIPKHIVPGKLELPSLSIIQNFDPNSNLKCTTKS